MLVADTIIKVTKSSDYVFWACSVGRNGVCNAVRVSAFKVNNDNEHITFFLPEKLFKQIQYDLLPGSNLSFLMVSVKDFESYQIKGNYVGQSKCTEENIDYFRLKVLKTIDIISGMGLNGQGIFGFLLELPAIAITMHCKENFLQTPKPGTGGKIEN